MKQEKFGGNILLKPTNLWFRGSSHHLGEYHAVERFAVLEGEQDGDDAILTEGAGGDMYLGLLGLFFVLFHVQYQGLKKLILS